MQDDTVCLSVQEVSEIRQLLAGVRPIRPFVASIIIVLKFAKWIAGELKWITVIGIMAAALYRGELLSFLSNL